MAKVIISLCGRKRTGKETAYKLVYPYLDRPEEFQFATPIKQFLINLLGLSWEQCYGPTQDRESLTRYSWGDVAEHIRKKYKKEPDDILTAREIHQVIGTDLMRQGFYSNIWAEAGVLAAFNSSAQTCVFTDTRFPNELDACRAPNVKNQEEVPNSIIVRLYRETGLDDAHDSETALDMYDVVPNQKRIPRKYHDKLFEMGYTRINNILWKGKNTPFDYLIDNNSTVENLNEHMLFILKDRGIFVEPTLS
jgi:hypothetical protein